MELPADPNYTRTSAQTPIAISTHGIEFGNGCILEDTLPRARACVKSRATLLGQRPGRETAAIRHALDPLAQEFDPLGMGQDPEALVADRFDHERRDLLGCEPSARKELSGTFHECGSRRRRLVSAS